MPLTRHSLHKEDISVTDKRKITRRINNISGVSIYDDYCTTGEAKRIFILEPLPPDSSKKYAPDMRNSKNVIYMDEGAEFVIDGVGTTIHRIKRTTDDAPKGAGKIWLPVEPVVETNEGVTVASAPMACFTLEEGGRAIPTMHCVVDDGMGRDTALRALEWDHYDADAIRARLGETNASKVSEFASQVVNTVPDVVYHKCSVNTLLNILDMGEYCKHDVGDERDVLKNVEKSKVMSTSDRHLDILELVTARRDQSVTLELEIPTDVCPMRCTYDLPSYERGGPFSANPYVYYDTPNDGDIDVLFSVEYMKHAGQKHLACKMYSPHDYDRYAKRDGFAHESEVVLLADKVHGGIPIPRSSIRRILAEGECGVSVDRVKDALTEAGHTDMLDKVEDSEFCMFVGETADAVVAGKIHDLAHYDVPDAISWKSFKFKNWS